MVAIADQFTKLVDAWITYIYPEMPLTEKEKPLLAEVVDVRVAASMGTT